MPTPLGSLLRRGLRALAAVLAVGAGACTSQNLDHCNFRGGDSFCAADQSARPFCSVCVADFDGCTDDPPSAECLPEGSSSASASGSSTATSQTDTTTTTSTTADTTSTSTSASTSTSTGETTTTTGDTTTGTTTTSTTTTSTTGTTTEDTTSSTTEADLCGNGVLDENEVCDGDKFGGKTCLDFGWTGGKLSCADDCSAIGQAGCCQGAESNCSGNMPCCDGLTCTFQSFEFVCK